MTLNSGLIAGMNVVGAAFKKNEVYVPEVLIAARAMKMAMEILEPKLVEAGVEPIGTVVIGTVKGDLHDIGKNLVAMMLKGAGFNVVAMEPYDTLAPRALRKLSPNCKVSATCWPTAGKTLAQMENWSRGVRAMKPDLVVIAVPAAAPAPTEMETFIRSYSAIVNLSQAFGRSDGPSGWDVVAITPAGQGVARDIILGHDITCIKHGDGEKISADEMLLRWLRAQGP